MCERESASTCTATATLIFSKTPLFFKLSFSQTQPFFHKPFFHKPFFHKPFFHHLSNPHFPQSFSLSIKLYQKQLKTLDFNPISAMPMNKEPATPPMIGKIGPYTVFVTPPATPKPSFQSPPPPVQQPVQPPPVKSAPPVLPPPVQYEKSASAYGSKFGFFWDAVAKVQNAHSSLDDHVARWFGLNQSKYQWALDDYYEKKGVDQVDAKVKDVSTKAQSV